ncbi:unnamed protein product [Amoebophrya sp. A120]|nr:unnamed protein product [Amoebophrya sp. A120]|eukprot:GSA120T00024723001.1
MASTEKGALLATEAGAKIGAFASSNFGGLWKFLFFVGAGCVTAGGVLGIIGGISSFLSPFSFCNQVYLLIFGLLMLILDMPYENTQLHEIRLAIFRYLLFMTRFTGRGAWYLFLATMIWASLFNLGLDPMIGFVLAAVVGALGGVSVYFGVQKSMRLEKLRKAICAKGANAVLDMVPARGLTLEEFNELAKQNVTDLTFSTEELHYISRALSFRVRHDDIISQEEFRSWTQGSMTIL